MYRFFDGTNWFAVGSATTVQMNDQILVGFAMVSNSDKPNGADFDHLKIEVVTIPAIAMLRLMHPGNVMLYQLSYARTSKKQGGSCNLANSI